MSDQEQYDPDAVHATHCCGRCGCKYGDDDCPVKLGRVEGIERSACDYCFDEMPIDMVLPCPKCGKLHIDAPEPATGWTNSVHTSHLCSACGCIWRPADVPTNGVAAVKTRGERDTPNDDAEPTTREWLEAVGFIARRNGVGMDLAMNHPAGPWLYCSCNAPGMTPDWYFDNGYGPLLTCADLPTRGHVRHLCSALGVTLKEKS